MCHLAGAHCGAVSGKGAPAHVMCSYSFHSFRASAQASVTALPGYPSPRGVASPCHMSPGGCERNAMA